MQWQPNQTNRDISLAREKKNRERLGNDIQQQWYYSSSRSKHIGYLYYYRVLGKCTRIWYLMKIGTYFPKLASDWSIALHVTHKA